MKKKLLLLLVCSMTAVWGFAQSWDCGANVRATLETGTLTISGTGMMTNYASAGSVPWYTYRTSITAVSIGSEITGIGNYAFNGCTGLTSVTIPGSVTSIGQYVFQDCSGLTELTLPFVGNSATATGSSAILGYLFGTTSNSNMQSVTQYYGPSFSSTYTTTRYFPKNLKKITVTSPCTKIEYGAFSNCSMIEEINLSTGVASIGEYAFYGCSKLPTVTIPSSMTSIGISAFRESGITSMTIPDNVKSIGNYAFSGCSGLMSVTIPTGMTSIGDYAFSSCSGLTSVTVPVASIGQYAFSSCSGLTSLIMTTDVKSIGQYAFNNCTGLTSVTIPESTTSIGQYVFQDCSGLTELTLPFVGTSATATGSSAILGYLFGTSSGAGMQSVTQYYSSLSSAYTTRYFPRNLKKITVTSPCSKIEYGAFYGCSMIEEIHLSTGVGSIGSSAFQGCANLISVNIPENVKSIEAYTFYDCSQLPTVTIPAGVTSIGDRAFQGCSGLPAVVMPAGLTNIGISAFQGCSGLTSMTVPNSVTAIGSSVFSGCSKLTELILPFIGTRANATLESGILGIMFGSSGATTVTQYYAPDEYKNYAIPPALEKLTITRPCTHLEYGALFNCSMLKEITLESSVTGLGTYSLSGCSGLEHIYVKQTMPPAAYANTTFRGVSKFACILHVPVGSKQYYSHSAAVGWNEFVLIKEEEGYGITVSTGNSLQVYLNPTSETFRISGISENTVVTLLDIGGKIVLQRTVAPDEPVFVEHLPAGMYIVRAAGETMKLVKR